MFLIGHLARKWLNYAEFGKHGDLEVACEHFTKIFFCDYDMDE